MTSSIQIPKLKVLIKLLDDDRFKHFTVLDVGGTKRYRGILREVFPNAELIILNVDDNVESKPSVRADATQLPFKNGTWDVVTSFDTLEHLSYPDKFLAEAYRVLKSGGYFILSTPNLATFYNRIVFTLGYTPFDYEPSRFYVGRICGNFKDIGERSPGNMGHIAFLHIGALKTCYRYTISQS